MVKIRIEKSLTILVKGNEGHDITVDTDSDKNGEDTVKKVDD